MAGFVAYNTKEVISKPKQLSCKKGCGPQKGQGEKRLQNQKRRLSDGTVCYGKNFINENSVELCVES